MVKLGVFIIYWKPLNIHRQNCILFVPGFFLQTFYQVHNLHSGTLCYMRMSFSILIQNNFRSFKQTITQTHKNKNGLCHGMGKSVSFHFTHANNLYLPNLYEIMLKIKLLQKSYRIFFDRAIDQPDYYLQPFILPLWHVFSHWYSKMDLRNVFSLDFKSLGYSKAQTIYSDYHGTKTDHSFAGHV